VNFLNQPGIGGFGPAFSGIGPSPLGFGGSPFGGAMDRLGGLDSMGGMMGMGGLNGQLAMQMQQTQMLMMMMMEILMSLMNGQGMGGASAGGGSGSGGGVGGGDGSGGGSGSAGGATDTSGSGAPNSGGAGAVALAQSKIGQQAQNVSMANYSHAGGVTNDCADFVSGVIANTEGFKKTGGDASVSTFKGDLQKQGWVQVSKGQSQPGDVAIIQGNGVSHTELVASAGAASAIGANGSSQESVSKNNLDWASGVTYWHKPG
jgi:hypothetical protein